MELSCPLTFVYWIHKPEHTDKTTQGYIGVTSNPKRRFNDHKRDAANNKHPNNYLSNAINKYNDLVFEVIFINNSDTCYNLEKTLRPKPSIGWNLMSGGPVGKITAEGRKRLSKARKGKTLTENEKLTRRWKSHCKTNPYISRKEYIDLYYISIEKVPPSKSSLPIFSVELNEEYPSIAEAAIVANMSPFILYLICEEKTKEWIYLKDL